MKYITLVASIIVTISAIFADKVTSPKQIAQELKNEIEYMENIYYEEDNLKPVVYRKSKYTNFYLDTFKIRVRPFATFKIPGIVSLRIRPRFALIWGRELPYGWEKYSH